MNVHCKLVNQDGNGNPPVSRGNKSSFLVYVPLPVLVYQSVPFLPNRKPPLISIVLFFSSLVTMTRDCSTKFGHITFMIHDTWLCLGCLEKEKTFKWWFDGDDSHGRNEKIHLT